MEHTFNGDNAALVESIRALLSLNEAKAVSHPVPGMAVQLLSVAADRLDAAPSALIKAGEVIGPRRHGPGICRGCPAFETEDWREPSGDGETFDSGQYAWCKAAERKSMGAYHYDTSPTPSWCPALTKGEGDVG